MSLSSNQKNSVLSDINVTPLVDVMLVLLIIFMVTAPLIQHGIKVDLPKANATTVESKEDQLIVTITKDLKYYIGDNAFTIEEFQKKIPFVFKARKDKSIYINADSALPYGAVVKAMAVIKNAGFEELGLITEPMTEKKE